jgi:putative solute:sodium symporter small subunit
MKLYYYATKGESMTEEKAKAYWRENISTILKLLAVWFIVSYGAGILFINQLNTIEISGVKLGFWFAQQGAIYVFVILIFVYVRMMNRLDEKYDVHE